MGHLERNWRGEIICLFTLNWPLDKDPGNAVVFPVVASLQVKRRPEIRLLLQEPCNCHNRLSPFEFPLARRNKDKDPGNAVVFPVVASLTSKDDRKYVCVCKSLVTVITGSLPLNSSSLFRRKCKTCRGVPRLLNQLRRHHCLVSVPFFARPKPKIICSETTRKRLTIALVMAARSTYLGTGSAYSTK